MKIETFNVWNIVVAIKLINRANLLIKTMSISKMDGN